YVSNGVPLALSQLARPVANADKIDGVSYNQFYGQLAGRVGSALNDATDGQQVQQSLLAQAKDLRQQYSGVSLDEEATILIQFQRGYQATSKFITLLVRNSQIQSNLGLAKTNADAADTALSSAIKLMDRALVLGA